MAVGQKHWGVVMFGCCFQSPWQEGCRWWHGETKKPHTETEMPVFYCAPVSKTDACLTCWSIPFNKESIHERACLQNPCLLISILFFFVVVFFLKCCRHSWHLCHLKVTAALPIFTWRHPHHWELFWEMATCPLIQKCDFWMECRQMISAEWVSSRGRLLHLIFFVW